MNPIPTLRRLAAVLAGLAAAALVFGAAAPAAFAYRLPPSGGDGAAPGQSPVHTAVAGGMPGWQITLVAVAAAALAAVAAVRADRARVARQMNAPTS
jgi:hypothetical protein